MPVSAGERLRTPVRTADYQLNDLNRRATMPRPASLIASSGITLQEGAALPAAPAEVVFYRLTTVPNKFYVSLEGTAGWNWYPLVAAV